ncbi:MAG: SLAC1 anion channel family protein [Rhodocyclaceae bacterium]|nr:SLAC1 anion channel family protein [Rhodocyclaceae bacterium]
MNTPPTPRPQRLEHFPIAFFAAVMGTTGLALAWKKAHHVLGMPAEIGLALQWWAFLLFVVIALVYLAKIALRWEAVKQEFAHPVRMNFFPAASVSLLLLAAAFADVARYSAAGLWLAGAALHLVFTLAVMSSWLHHTRYEIKHANPAWFIPVVGNIVAPVGGAALAPIELSWFFFSIGLVFWSVLFTIVLYRLFFHEPLPERLTPTLFILIAPPAVGSIAWVRLHGGEIDDVARILYYAALFLTLLLAANAMRFFRLRFFLSTWAYSFPLAAMTVATLMMAEHAGGLFLPLGWLLLAILSLVLALLTVRTALAIVRGEICVPE